MNITSVLLSGYELLHAVKDNNMQAQSLTGVSSEPITVHEPLTSN